jgi:hypothetical protein
MSKHMNPGKKNCHIQYIMKEVGQPIKNGLKSYISWIGIS